jgi:hypothetical protein
LLGQKEVDELLSSTEFRQLKQSFCKMLLLCLPRCIRKTRFKKLIDKGNSKIDQSLDIRTLIETNRATRVLIKILLNARQKTMTKLTKLNFLGSETSSEEEKVVTDEEEHKVRMQKFLGYKI